VYKNQWISLSLSRDRVHLHNSIYLIVIIPALIISGALMTLSCGGGGTTQQPGTKVAAKLAPATATVLTSQTQQMTFTPGTGGSTSVTWWVNNTTGGDSTVGTVDSSGLYTAPVVPPSPNAVTIQAKSSTETAQATLTVVSPEPSVGSVTPSVATAGSTGTQVTVSGAGFTPQSSVELGGTPLTTTFVSDSELTVTLSAATLANVGIAQIDVTTPAPGGGTSAMLPFTIVSAGVVSTTNNPQVADYSITSPSDTNVTVQFGTDASYGLQTWAVPTPLGGGKVDVLVAGMRSLTTYHMRAVLDFADGTQFFDADHTFDTGGADPTRLPNFTLTVPPGPTASPGVEMYSLLGVGALKTNPLNAVVTDLDGNVIWYYDYTPSTLWSFPLKLLANGHIMVNISSGLEGAATLREIDLAGNTIREITVNELTQKLQAAGYDLTLNTFHHDFDILPNGHLIILSSINRDFTDLPGYPGTITVVGDVLIDVDQDFNPVWVWNTFDHLDINRHPMGFPPDWTHGNAVIYSPDDGNLLFSMRHQHWVVKIDYEDGKGNGQILWHLGYQGDFALDQGAPASWQYGQHFPIILSPNSTGQFRLGVFDNGNDRVMDDSGTICGQTGAPACYSRPVIFDVDEDARTVHVEWKDIRSEFSQALGAIQELPNNDMTFDLGIFGPGVNSRFVEETKDSPPQVVWQIDLANAGQIAYRAVRLPSLYPGVQW
jgi:arylsulfate sulfotransferase